VFEHYFALLVTHSVYIHAIYMLYKLYCIFCVLQEILPVVFQLLDDATDNVKGVSCYVLEMFCENLQPATVLPFLPQLMNRLVQVRLYHYYQFYGLG
jgi:hypothetical protein